MVMGELTQETELLVIGGGPGGYAAAFRAADLGADVTLVDVSPRPGGVCLFQGCIPSKTLLHLAELITDASRADRMGLRFPPPEIDLEALREHKDRVIDQLAGGLVTLGDRRGIQRIRGRAVFESENQVRLHDAEIRRIRFKHAVLAAGSHPAPVPGMPYRKGGKIMDSTGALAFSEIPDTLLVLGGGYVGLELGSVYAAFGSRVTVVESRDRLLSGIDTDLVRPLQNRLEKRFAAIYLNTTARILQEDEDGITVRLETEKEGREEKFDRVLAAVGRKPNTSGIGLENTQVKTDARGFVIVDSRQRTSDRGILAVGDVTGGMMLAHKASYEGKIAAEVIAGQPSAFDAAAVPAVVYTDPQIACCGLSEEAAHRENRKVEILRFPWKFSGRALTMDRFDGLTKLVVDPETGRILGGGITGRESESLIAEIVLAVEMGALAQDMGLSIHPHPTLSETEMEAAGIFTGSAIHILPRRKP